MPSDGDVIDPTEFLANDLSAPLPKGYDERRFEGKSLQKIFGKGYNDVIKSRKFYVVIRGGKGSKKSKTIALLLIMRMMQYDMANTVCIRKSYNALKDSMFTDLLWAMDRLGVTDFWEVRRSPMQLELKHTHQVILFRGLDKAEKLGGLTVRHGYLCWMWIDEFYEITDEEEFTKAMMGLRGYMPPETGLWKQVFCTFNPWSEHTWIKKRFFDEPHDNVLSKVTTYKVNEWLGPEDIARYDELRETNPRLASVICDGAWGIAEGLVYENWDIQAFDVDELMRRPDVHETYGLDFGYKVSYTAFIGVLVDPVARELWIFEDSIYRTGMTNLDIAKAITALGYENKRIVADRAEQKSIYELKAGLLCEETDEWGETKVKRYSLPNITGAMKGNDSVTNGIARLQSYRMHVHPSCKNAIMELSSYYYEQDNEGRYTGKPHKDYDHCLLGTTAVSTPDGHKRIMDIEVGDLVNTPFGPKRVLSAGMSRPEPAQIWIMYCEGLDYCIHGTEDHPFPANPLDPSDEMCIPLRDMLGRKVLLEDGTLTTVVDVHMMPTIVKPVYDLTVEDVHVFYANGILTSNCLDALRYSCEVFISKTRGKVAEAKGGAPSHAGQVVQSDGTASEQVPRRSRRVASSNKGPRI